MSRGEPIINRGRLTQLLENDEGGLAFYFLYGRLRALANYDNTPQARRMMHVVIRSMVDEMEPIIEERLS